MTDVPDDIRKIAAEICDKYVGYDGPSSDEIEQALLAERQRWAAAPIDQEALRDWIATHDPEALMADGFEAAIIGVGERCSQPAIVVYDAEACVEILMQRDGMDYEGALEFFTFNTLGAWVGERTPLFVWRCTPDSILQFVDALDDDEYPDDAPREVGE